MKRLKSAFTFAVIFIFCCEVEAQRRGGGSSRSSGAGRSSGSGSSSGSGGRGYMMDLQLFYGSGQAQADPIVRTGFPNESNEFENKTGFYALKLARVFASGFNLAATYSVRNDERSGQMIKGQSQGLGLGYLDSSGATLRLFYHLGETYGDYSDGRGGSAELGYYLKLGTQFSVGFLLTHQRIQYFKNPLITDFKNWTAAWSHPVITLAYTTR